MVYENINNKNLTIAVPYSFKNEKLEIQNYEVLDFDNLSKMELAILEQIYNRGLLDFEDGKEIWTKHRKSNLAS